MSADFNVWGTWAVYLLSGGVFYIVLHQFTQTRKPSWWSYTVRALFFALMLTPWYANPQGQVLAPALMVTTLDLITLGTGAMSRALMPLLLAICSALIASTAFFFVQKKRLNNNDIS